MSGHSKWAQIKRQKGVADVRRGQTFTKLSNAITIAVKQGGGIGDPKENFHLRLAIDAAKAANMPKENIDRAIKRAAGRDGGDLAEVTYEGFAPGGILVIVEAATDNTNRTTSEVKSLFHKAGANLAQPGAVSYQFKNVGEIIISKDGRNLDDIFLIAADAGAEDVEDRGEEAAVFTFPENLALVRDKISSQGIKIMDASLSRQATSRVALDPEKENSVVDFLSSLENLEDVQKVYSNID